MAIANVQEIYERHIKVLPRAARFVEAYPRYDHLVTEIFRLISSGQFKGITSTVTLAEALVQPIQQGNVQLQETYRHLLLKTGNLQTLSIDPVVAELAADLRALSSTHAGRASDSDRSPSWLRSILNQ
jgi:hypothetical protein